MELVKAFAHWWPCACLKCVSGPRSPEKRLNFSKYVLVFDLVLQCCSDIIYWNWMQLFFHFFVFIDTVASVVGTIFFWLCSTFWIEIFSCCFLRKLLQLVSKSALITNGLSLGFFFLISGFIGWFWFWIDKNLQKCWNLCPIWRHKVFSITSLRVIPVCCSNVLVLLSQSFL